jgi:hypothetical protein
MAEFGGISYAAMLQQILRACEDRLAAGNRDFGRKSAGR